MGFSFLITHKFIIRGVKNEFKYNGDQSDKD